MKSTKNAGLTLIEVVIAAVILTAVVLMTLAILTTSTSAATKATLTGDLETRGRQFVDFCRNQFAWGRFRDPSGVHTLGLYSDNTEIRYQIPVNQSPGGNLEYGYTSRVGFEPAGVGRACAIRFEADTILKESAASPSATQPASMPPLPPLPALATEIMNADLNKDRDRLDTFVRGRIRLYVVDAAGSGILSRGSLGDCLVLAVTGANRFNGDMDGNASTPDLLFRYVDKNDAAVLGPTPGSGSVAVVVTAWHGNWDDLKKGFLVRRNTEKINFRNAQ